MSGSQRHRAVADATMPGALPRKPDGPVRLIWRALQWVLLAQACAEFAQYLPLFFVIRAQLLLALQGGELGSLPALAAPAGIPVDWIVMDVVLFIGAVRRAKAVGGEIAAGMGDAPVRRPAWLAGICGFAGLYAAAVGYVAGLSVRLGSGPAQTAIGDLGDFAHDPVAAQIVAVVHALLLAPLVEEMFFRGWLWEGLLPTCGGVATAALTAAACLAFDGLDGGWPRFTALLVPTALMTLARAACGGIRASALVHLVNNAMLFAAFRLMAWAAP
jgi:membrane protease YdiL (CAAX protease family)